MATTFSTIANRKFLSNPTKGSLIKSSSSTRQALNTIEINLIEDRVAGLLKASLAAAVKSSKSAVFYLAKNLLKRDENIVTLNSISLFKNEIVRERLGIEVRLADDDNLESFKNLVDENTKLIFLESLGVGNHIIPDFQKIIAFAHSKEILVAVDNTVGLAGNIFNPIAWGADYSIENFPSWTSTYGELKTLLIERKAVKDSITEKIKANLEGSTPLRLSENSIEKVKHLNSLPVKLRNISATTQSTAKWIKEVSHIKYVDFVGFKNHSSHFNALKYFSGGYGNVISFSLWANYRSFDFFLDNLIPGSFDLFKILDINYEQKKITISILNESYEQIVTHFQNAFELLQKYLGSDYFLYENLYETKDIVGY